MEVRARGSANVLSAAAAVVVVEDDVLRAMRCDFERRREQFIHARLVE